MSFYDSTGKLQIAGVVDKNVCVEEGEFDDSMECVEVVERLAEVYRTTFPTLNANSADIREDFHEFVMEGLEKCIEMRRASLDSSGSGSSECPYGMTTDFKELMRDN